MSLGAAGWQVTSFVGIQGPPMRCPAGFVLMDPWDPLAAVGLCVVPVVAELLLQHLPSAPSLLGDVQDQVNPRHAQTVPLPATWSTGILHKWLKFLVPLKHLSAVPMPCRCYRERIYIHYILSYII